MKMGRFRWPSLGFVLLALTWLSMIVFLAWGFMQPDLDVAWRAHQQVEHLGGVENLTTEQLEAVQRSLERHPQLVDELDPQLVEAARDPAL